MENQVNSKNIIINYGLFYGIGLVLISLIIYASGMMFEAGWISFILMSIVIIASIILAIKKFKTTNNGFLSWGQALKIGIGVALIGTIISIIYQQIFINYIEPDFVNQTLLKVEEGLLDAGYSEEMIESQLEMQKKFQKPAISIPLGLLFYTFIGFVISAIAGAIMKKDENNY